MQQKQSIVNYLIQYNGSVLGLHVDAEDNEVILCETATTELSVTDFDLL